MKYCTVCKEKFDDSVSFCPTDGEVLVDDPASIVGTVLDGQYKIESLLGKGGMGAVFLARHILLGDRVAIKVLPPEVRNNAEWLRRFRREGQAARRFRHANAVTVYDLRTAADGVIYMVMEYVEGETLDAALKKHVRFSPAETFQILEPIMSVLNAAHEMGVVHRDVKPENIMIGKPGSGGQSQVKLLDLGIAKMREIAGVESSGTTELTMAGQVLGTPYYMSPEQWGEISRDGNLEIDGRADIYSLGLVAYQMISGRRAYSSNTLHELRREHLQVNPPPLHQVVPGVPPAVGEAVARAISKDRADRQQTAGQFAAELRAAVKNSSVAPGPGRTAPDIPYPESHAHTRESSQAAHTNSDVNAPTIITVDAIPTTPLSAGAPVAPSVQPHGLVGANDMASSVTIPQRRGPSIEVAVPSRGRGKSMLLVGAGVLVVVLLIAGVGGIFAFNWFKGGTDDPSAGTGAKTSGKAATRGATSGGETPVSTSSEFGKYWLEILPPGLVAEPERIAGSAPLKSGQAFKFHFQIEQDGYLYIVGPGDENRLTAFLTAKPASISGLENNQISKGSDFSFPNGFEKWLELNKKPASETYTVIFSRTPITVPGFFAGQATGNPMSDDEQAEFKSFLAENKTAGVVTELHDKDPAAQFIAVKVPPSDGSKPVIFEIRIQHK